QLDYYSRRLPFTCEIAAKIMAPALVVSGDQSPLLGIAEKTAACLKDARFVRIPQATHWIPHDQPRKFSEELLGFLAHYKQPDELAQKSGREARPDPPRSKVYSPGDPRSLVYEAGATKPNEARMLTAGEETGRAWSLIELTENPGTKTTWH